MAVSKSDQTAIFLSLAGWAVIYAIAIMGAKQR